LRRMITCFFKRIIFNLYVQLIVLFILGAASLFASSEFSISSSVNTTIVAPKGELVLTIEFYWTGLSDAIEIEPAKAPDSYLLDLVSASQKNFFRMYPDKNINKTVFEYKFKASETGMGRISYFALEFTDKQTGVKRVEKTKPYDITVLSAGRYWLRQSALFVTYGVVALIIAGLIIVVVFVLRKRKFRAVHEKLMVSRAEAGLENQILAELKNLKRYKVSGEADKLLDSIVEILNKYFEQRYGISFSKAVSGTDKTALSTANIPEKMFIELKDITALSNRVKFSGEKLPPEDMDRWLRHAERIVRYFIDKSQKEQFDNLDIIDK